MDEQDATEIDDPIPNSFIVGILALLLGVPFAGLVFAALMRDPLFITVLGAAFGASVWWYVRTLRPAAPPPQFSRPRTPTHPHVRVFDATGWVKWSDSGHSQAHAVPITADSSRSRQEWIERLAQVLAPMETDLPSRPRRNRQYQPGWSSVDDEPDRSIVALHLDGFRFPRTFSSAGIDAVMTDTATGCTIQGWVRPSRSYMAAAIAATVVFGGLAAVVAVGAVGEGGSLSSALITIACVAFAAFTLTQTLQLTQQLVDEIVSILEDAGSTRALTPARGFALDGPPARLVTSRERAVRRAATRVGVPSGFRGSGFLPTATLAATTVLLFVGSVTTLTP